MSEQWTRADQERHDRHEEDCHIAEAQEEIKRAAGMIEALEGDLESALERIADLEAAITTAIDAAARIFAAIGEKDIATFCDAHLSGVMLDGKKQAAPIETDATCHNRGGSIAEPH